MADEASDVLAGAAPPSPLQLDQPNVPVGDSSNLGPVPMQGQPQQPMPIQSSPQLTDTIPSETAPNNPDIERQDHEAWWKRGLDKVATMLGGGTTYHVQTDEHGNVTGVDKEPSTRGEKWGRIAAAALGGAAQGLANSQGPGGLARAAAAGTQYGMQIPKQMQDNANAQVTAAQKSQLFKANMAKMQQDHVIASQTMQDNDIKINKELNDSYKDFNDHINSGDGSDFIGNFEGVKDLPTFNKQHPEAMGHHTNGELQLLPIYNADRTLWGSAAYHIMPSADQQPVGKNIPPIPVAYIDPDGKMQTRYDQPTPETKMGAYRSAYSAQETKNSNLYIANKKADNDANKQKNPTIASLAQDWATETDPVKKQQDRQALDAAKAKGGGGGANGAVPGTNVQAAQIRDQGGSIDQALGAIPIGDRATVKAVGEGRMAPPSRFTKQGQQLMGEVNSVYPDYDGTQFKTYQDARTKFATGPEGIGLNFIQTARNHLDRMETNIPDNVTIPWGVGSLVNSVKNAANRSTSPKLKAFEDDMNAVTSEVARAYTGKALTDSEHDKMLKLLNESDSPAALQGAIGEFRELLNGKLQSYRTQWNSAMPRGVVSPNGTLEALEAGTSRPQPQPQPQQQPQAQPRPAAAAAPFKPAQAQPPNPPFAGAVFGAGPQGTGWYPPQGGR